MIIEYTAEELQHLEELKTRYDKLLSEADVDLNILTMQYLSEYEEYTKQCQRARLESIWSDKDKILDNAREQAPKIIEHEYNSFNEDIKKQIAGLDNINIGCIEGGKFYFKTDFAIDLLRTELALHAEALKDDTKKQQELFKIIIEEVENNPLTNNEKVDLPLYEAKIKNPNITRYSRTSPLAIIKKYGLMNDNLTKHIIITEPFINNVDGQMTMLWTVPQGNKNKSPVLAYIALSYEGEEFKLNKKLKSFDKSVYEAVSNIYVRNIIANNEQVLFTPQDVWRTMNGITDTKRTPSPNQTKKICDSLDKMRFVRCRMDVSNELKANYLKIEDSRVVNGQIDTYLLSAEKIIIVNEKGKEYVGYSINKEPILYTYNKAKGHILLIPYKYLNTSKITGNEGNTIEIRNYLLQQIYLLKERKRNNNRILFSTLYKELGIESPEERILKENYTNNSSYKAALSREKKKDITKITDLLTFWKQELIQDFSLVKKNRNYIGVDIVLPAKEITQSDSTNSC